jgi:hypothetical protein
MKRLDKDPVRCLQTYLTKHDQEKNIAIMTNQFPNISKWTTNSDIDNELSNDFWHNPLITDAQWAMQENNYSLEEKDSRQ